MCSVSHSSAQNSQMTCGGSAQVHGIGLAQPPGPELLEAAGAPRAAAPLRVRVRVRVQVQPGGGAEVVERDAPPAGAARQQVVQEAQRAHACARAASSGTPKTPPQASSRRQVWQRSAVTHK